MYIVQYIGQDYKRLSILKLCSVFVTVLLFK